jgi:hypothetical protein
MSHGRYQYEKAATSIITWFHLAEDDLVNHTLVLANGETGTCRAIKLDEHHGLCFTIEDPEPLDGGPMLPNVAAARRWYPVSTIKIHGPKVKPK